MAETLAGDLPAGQTIRRHTVWSRNGDSVNVHRVLRGDLAHAWRKTVCETTLTHGEGTLILAIPAIVTCNISHAQIYWSAVATLALADYARRQGRTVEIWALG